jgi:hypothetical protein
MTLTRKKKPSKVFAETSVQTDPHECPPNGGLVDVKPIKAKFDQIQEYFQELGAAIEATHLQNFDALSRRIIMPISQTEMRLTTEESKKCPFLTYLQEQTDKGIEISFQDPISSVFKEKEFLSLHISDDNTIIGYEKSSSDGQVERLPNVTISHDGFSPADPDAANVYYVESQDNWTTASEMISQSSVDEEYKSADDFIPNFTSNLTFSTDSDSEEEKNKKIGSVTSNYPAF